MELIKELVGIDKSQLEKDKRIKKAKNDFGFFCRYYLSDYFLRTRQSIKNFCMK